MARRRTPVPASAPASRSPRGGNRQSARCGTRCHRLPCTGSEETARRGRPTSGIRRVRHTCCPRQPCTDPSRVDVIHGFPALNRLPAERKVGPVQNLEGRTLDRGRCHDTICVHGTPGYHLPGALQKGGRRLRGGRDRHENKPQEDDRCFHRSFGSFNRTIRRPIRFDATRDQGIRPGPGCQSKPPGADPLDPDSALLYLTLYHVDGFPRHPSCDSFTPSHRAHPLCGGKFLPGEGHIDH